MIVHEEKSFAMRSLLFFSYFKELIFLETAMRKINAFFLQGNGPIRKWSLKWSQKIVQLANVYPEPLKGIRDDKAICMNAKSLGGMAIIDTYHAQFMFH